MRIVLITGSYPPLRCGVGDYTASLARALARTPGHQVHVVTSAAASQNAADDAAGVQVHAIVARWSVAAWSPTLRTCRRLAPDIVHMQFPTQGYEGHRFPWLMPVLLRMRGLCIVQTWHEHLSRKQSFVQIFSSGEAIVVRPNYVASLGAAYRRVLARRPVTYIPGASAIPVSRLDAAARTTLRAQFAAPDERLLAYFGFVYPHKGIEDLFEIVDPQRDRLLLVCELSEDHAYHRLLRQRIEALPWASRVTITGHVSAERAADLMACADAVVLPFREGSGEWNSSVQAARLQGNLVVTTSAARRGYDAGEHVAYCAPGDCSAMRAALDPRADERRVPSTGTSPWDGIAARHLEVYERARGRG